MTDMTMTDATILASLLTELRLPSIARNWKRITEAANREGWPAQKTRWRSKSPSAPHDASSVIVINPKRRLEKPSPASTSPPRRS